MTLAQFVAARLEDRWSQAHRNIGAAQYLAGHPYLLGTPSTLTAVAEAYRSLRVVEAQRRTYARHASCGHGTGYCDDGGKAWAHDDPGGPGCAELQDLAAPDHEHPDFNPTWKADES